MKLPKSLTFDHRLSKVESNVVKVRAIGVKEANAFFALAAFMKLPKSLTFDHRLSKVEPNVVKVRAIGVKEANALFALAAFMKLPKSLTFGHCLSVSRGQVKLFFSLVLSSVFLL
jgi:hypothetical protein